MTYNVRACLGLDGRRSVSRIAEVIRRESPDAVALQELDAARARSEHVDQADAIADLLDMSCLHGPSFDDPAGGHYGNAVLTPHHAALRRHALLPSSHGAEPRSAMWVRIEPGHAPPIDLINTHFGLLSRDRRRQAETILGPDWLASPDISDRVVLCADLNCTTLSRAHRLLRARLPDAQRRAPTRLNRPTWPSRLPFLRIDHVFASGALIVTGAYVPRTPLTRRASDHLPLIVDVEHAARKDGGRPAATGPRG